MGIEQGRHIKIGHSEACDPGEFWILHEEPGPDGEMHPVYLGKDSLADELAWGFAVSLTKTENPYLVVNPQTIIKLPGWIAQQEPEEDG